LPIPSLSDDQQSRQLDSRDSRFAAVGMTAKGKPRVSAVFETRR
jgi:hypothetical protein